MIRSIRFGQLVVLFTIVVGMSMAVCLKAESPQPTPIPSPSETEFGDGKGNAVSSSIDQRLKRLREQMSKIRQSNRKLRERVERLESRVDELERGADHSQTSHAGQLKWKKRIAPEGSRHGALSVSPAIHPNGSILVTGRGEERSLHVFDTSGREKWTLDQLSGEPVVGPDGMIYLRSLRKGDIAAVDPRTRQVDWESTNTSGGARVSVGPGESLYTQNSNGRVFKLSADDGTLNWRFDSPIDGERFGDGISIDREGILYLTGHSLRGQGHRQLYALRPDGRVKWTYRYRGESRSMPAIGANGTVYAVINFGGGLRNSNGTLVAFGTKGEVKWRLKTGDKVTHMNDATFRSRSQPVVGPEGRIYVGSSNGHVYAINSNGTRHWTFDANDPVKSTPAIGSNGHIYVGTEGGDLIALNSRGKEEWRYRTDGRIHGSVNIGEDGTLYFTSWDGHLYAVSSNAGGLAESTWPRYRGNQRQSGLVISR